MDLTRGRGAERKTCPKLDPALAHSGLQMSWSDDSAGEKDPMILSTHERASQARRAPAGSGVLQLRRLMPAAELESRLRCVRRRKMGAPKTENAVLCASSLHTSAGAMDPKRWRPSSQKISIAERVARGSAHGGAWCGSADGYFTRYFAPRGPDRRPRRPDRRKPT